MSLARKIRCRVDSIVHHGEHVYTVNLIPARPAPAFQPGQFLHLTVDDYNPAEFWPESRVFSIASSPRERDRICICYSVVGGYTKRMEQALRVDGQVWIKLPYGDFVVAQTGDVVLFAGGTGITAFTAFLESLEPDPQRAICLAYGARTRELLIYRDLVHRCGERVPALDISYFIEQSSAPAAIAKRGNEAEYAGRISVAALWPRINKPLAAAYYISGPPAMLKTLSDDLRANGIAQKAISVDAWE